MLTQRQQSEVKKRSEVNKIDRLHLRIVQLQLI